MAGFWTYPPFGEELFEHAESESPGYFDMSENDNLLSSAKGQRAVSPEHRNLSVGLFEQLRATVIERHGVIDPAFLRCSQRSDRLSCQKKVLADLLEPDPTTPSEWVERQRSKGVDQLLRAPVARPPFKDSQASSGLMLTKLKRLRLFPDEGMHAVNHAGVAFERVARVGDEVVVADVDRIAQVMRVPGWQRSEGALVHGALYRVASITDAAHVGDVVTTPTPDVSSGGDNNSELLCSPPRDLVLHLVKEDYSDNDVAMRLNNQNLTAGDAQAMRLGYVPREATGRVAGLLAGGHRTAFTEMHLAPEAGLFAPYLPPSVLPQVLYAPSRCRALVAAAGWDDMVDHVQWIPRNVTLFECRQGRACPYQDGEV
jgi:hypothetical protein